MANRDPNPVNPTWRPDTVLVHGQGEVHPYGATLPPVVVSTAFEHGSAEQMEEVFAHERVGHAYSRLSNPTVTSLEDRITAISGTREMPARGTVAVASGMSAVALALLGILKTGDHVVASKHLFGGTHTLLETTLCRLGVATTRVDARHDDEIEAAIQPETRAVLVEAIANPAMAVPDFDALRRCCKSAGIPLIVDGTLVTPLLLDAEATGADVAVYSGSKFLAGAATTIGGLIVDTGRFPWGQGGNPGKQNRAGKQNQAGKENTVSRVHLGDFQRQGPRGYLDRIRHELMVGVGPSLSPQAAFLQIVGLETLALRLQRQESNTQRIAEWLGRHVAVSAVLYPGLTGHPDRERCRRAFRGHCGSVLSFTLANRAACFGFLNALHLVRRASNLGDTRSLALHPASTIYHGYWPAQRADLGVPDTLIRLSLGIEDPDDLIADLEQALAATV